MVKRDSFGKTRLGKRDSSKKETGRISTIDKRDSFGKQDRPTRLLQFVAFVHSPFSFRSLELVVASMDHCCLLGTPLQNEYNEHVKNDEHDNVEIEYNVHVKNDEHDNVEIEYNVHVKNDEHVNVEIEYNEHVKNDVHVNVESNDKQSLIQ